MALIQKTVSGGILMTTSGGIPGSCCCGGTTTNACSTTTCPDGLGGTWPSMQIALYDPSRLDGEGNLTWCGETFTPEQIRAGTKRCLCPSGYTLEKRSGTGTSFSGTQRVNYERWAHSELGMARGYGVARNGGDWYQIDNYNAKWLAIDGYTTLWIPKGSDATAPPWTPTTTYKYTSSGWSAGLGGLIGGVPRALYGTPDKYRITDAFFGSWLNTVTGVEYRWNKGNGW